MSFLIPYKIVPCLSKWQKPFLANFCCNCINNAWKSLTSQLICLIYQFEELNHRLCWGWNKRCRRWHGKLALFDLSLGLSLSLCQSLTIPVGDKSLEGLKSHRWEKSGLRYLGITLWKRNIRRWGNLLNYRCPFDVYHVLSVMAWCVQKKNSYSNSKGIRLWFLKVT